LPWSDDPLPLPSPFVPPISVRLATPADAEQIRSIYNHEVMHTVATFDLVPRSIADQQEWLAARSGAFAAIVAVEPAADGPAAEPGDVGSGEVGSGEVVGFGALSAYKERAAYRTSVENSVYVRRDRHGRGIGRLLLEELLSTAELSGFHAVFARINASSEASIALHRRCGYELVGIEREVGRKFSRWHDVALMERLL
jgi:phosphinothricin acetyltransferase